MNQYRGMTLKEFGDTVESMRTLYPFKDETTRICELNDIVTNAPTKVEIVTKDEPTNTTIVMSKPVERNENEY